MIVFYYSKHTAGYISKYKALVYGYHTFTDNQISILKIIKVKSRATHDSLMAISVEIGNRGMVF